jgi:hypothetical protein
LNIRTGWEFQYNHIRFHWTGLNLFSWNKCKNSTALKHDASRLADYS